MNIGILNVVNNCDEFITIGVFIKWTYPSIAVIVIILSLLKLITSNTQWKRTKRHFRDLFMIKNNRILRRYKFPLHGISNNQNLDLVNFFCGKGKLWKLKVHKKPLCIYVEISWHIFFSFDKKDERMPTIAVASASSHDVNIRYESANQSLSFFNATETDFTRTCLFVSTTNNPTKTKPKKRRDGESKKANSNRLLIAWGLFRSVSFGFIFLSVSSKKNLLKLRFKDFKNTPKHLKINLKLNITPICLPGVW